MPPYRDTCTRCGHNALGYQYLMARVWRFICLGCSGVRA